MGNTSGTMPASYSFAFCKSNKMQSINYYVSPKFKDGNRRDLWPWAPAEKMKMVNCGTWTYVPIVAVDQSESGKNHGDSMTRF